VSFLQSPRDRAALLILALGIAIVLALSPFLSGLLGTAVLYVMFVPLYERLERRMKPGRAAGITLLVALVAIGVPLVWLLGMVIGEAPGALRGVQGSAAFAGLSHLRIGTVQVGAELAKASGSIVSWASSQLFAFIGGATSAALNLVIAFFGLYYMLRSGGNVWIAVRPYIPFSPQTSDALRDRFVSVTEATLLGTVLVAVLQGMLVGLGFWIVGLPSPLFWGTVTAFASILPVLGSALVWLPGVVVLILQDRYGAAIGLAVIGGVIASNLDNLLRPLIYKRVSDIHPMITLIGAFAGVKWFGLLGVLLGPLAIAYLFELVQFYRDDYGIGEGGRRAATRSLEPAEVVELARRADDAAV
jgi:predicted PurR-regulated permease PerM